MGGAQMKTAQEIVSQPAETATAKTNSKRGRPVQYAMPDPIPDTPENIMRALLSAPPRRENDWDYSRRSGRQTKRPQLIAMKCKTVALVRIVYKSQLFLRSAAGRRQIERFAAGTSASMKKVNAHAIRQLSIALPSSDTQDVILRASDGVRSARDSAERRLRDMKRMRSTMLSSIL